MLLSATWNESEGAPTEGKDYMVVERVRLLDRMGFDRPVEAFSMLFPKGWKVDGGVRWLGIGQCRGDMISPHVKATAPDGTMSFELFPSRSFNWTDEPMMLQAMMAGASAGGCAVNQPFDARQYIEGYAKQDLGATASEIHIDEARMPFLRKVDQQANDIARQYGNATEQNSTFAFGKITFPDGSEGIAHVGVTNTLTRKPDMNRGSVVITTTAVFHFALMRYPAGRKEEAGKLFNMFMTGQRMNPVWQQAKTNFLTQLGNIEHAGRMEKIRLMGEQAAAYAKSQSDASDARMRAWEVRQASQDKQHKAFVQAIREVETWRDATGSVELSSGYDQAWSRGDGTYLLSNKPGFDPNAVFKERRWTEMKRAD